MPTTTSLRSSVFAVLALTLAVVAARPASARSFDTDGDGDVDISVFDTDGDGYLEWPTGTKSLPGVLHFLAGDRVAFRGTTAIQTANGIVADVGTELASLPGAPLQKLTLTANRGDILLRGDVTLALTGDLAMTAYRGLFLFGPTRISAIGRATFLAKNAFLAVSPFPPPAEGTFTVLAGKQLTLTSKGNAANLRVEGARLGSRVVTLGVQTSAVGPQFVLDGALVTTNPARTGLSGTPGHVTMSQQRSGIVVRNGSTVDSGRNVVLKAQYISTAHPSRGVCLGNGSAIVANGGAGVVDTRLVAGLGPFRDASSVVLGTVVGSPFVLDAGC